MTEFIELLAMAFSVALFCFGAAALVFWKAGVFALWDRMIASADLPSPKGVAFADHLGPAKDLLRAPDWVTGPQGRDVKLQAAILYQLRSREVFSLGRASHIGGTEGHIVRHRDAWPSVQKPTGDEAYAVYVWALRREAGSFRVLQSQRGAYESTLRYRLTFEPSSRLISKMVSPSKARDPGVEHQRRVLNPLATLHTLPPELRRRIISRSALPSPY